MIQNLTDFLEELRRAGCEPKQSGDSWRCACPVHQGSRDSLAVSAGDKHPVVIKCHSGDCTYQSLCEHLGLKVSATMEAGKAGKKRRIDPPAIEANPPVKPEQPAFEIPEPWGGNKVHKKATKAVSATAWSMQSNNDLDEKPIPEVWVYHYGNGELAMLVLRFDFVDKETNEPVKDYRQIRRVVGGWQAGSLEQGRPLYGLVPINQEAIKSEHPELKRVSPDETCLSVLDAKTVYVCEGEKAADALRALGLTAVSPSQGAESPHLTDWTPLAEKHVVIVPDNDDSGHNFVGRVWSLIHKVARDTETELNVEIKLLAKDEENPGYPEFPEKGDAYDWSEMNDSSEAEQLIERLEALPNAISEYRLKTLEETKPEVEAKFESPEFKGKSAGEIWSQADEPIPWMVKGVFSADQPTIFGAKKKSLKTTFLLDLAVSLASGTDWLDKFEVPKRLRVLFITGESNYRATARRMRRAANAKRLNKDDLNDWLRIEADDFPKFPNQNHCEAIQTSIDLYKIDVVIVDPLYRGMDGSVNAGNLFEMGDALGSFVKACQPAAVIISHHFRKNVEFQKGLPDLDDLSQAGVAEFAGNFWLMGREGEYQGDGHHRMQIQYGGRDEQYGSKLIEFDEKLWTARVTSLKDHLEDRAQREQNAEEMSWRKKVLKALEHYPDGNSESQLAEFSSTKRTRAGFRMAIKDLEELGIIELVPGFKAANRRECVAWKLTEKPEADPSKTNGKAKRPYQKQLLPE